MASASTSDSTIDSRVAVGAPHSAKIILAQLNISTGSPQGAGNHNLQNSNGQNIGGGGNNNSQAPPTPIGKIYLIDNCGHYATCSQRGMPSGVVYRDVFRVSGTRGSYNYVASSSNQCMSATGPAFSSLSLVGSINTLFTLNGTAKAQSTSQVVITGYRYTSTASRMGQVSATVPPTYPSSTTGIRLMGGNAYEGNNGGIVCAIVSGNGTYCDGHGNSTLQGQLGNGSSAQQSGPKQVYSSAQSTAITDIDTTDDYSCVVTGGYLECWGKNYNGQLGIGSTNNQNLPKRVTSWQ